MKAYPSIPRWTEDLFGTHVWAFDKLDGSNVRAEWNQKKGFYKFGSRHHLIDESDPMLGESVTLIKAFQDMYAEVARRELWDSAVFFFEFWGPNSFAGSHVPGEEKTVTLLDVNVYRHGMLATEDTFRLFPDQMPKVLFEGKFDAAFVEQVQNGTLPGMTLEGVVCRAPDDANLVFKVKNAAWLKRLRERCGDNDELFKKLA